MTKSRAEGTSQDGPGVRPEFPTRRELMAAVGSVVCATAFPASAQAAPPVLADPVPKSEGFFFIVAGATAEADRIFYLKSAWLPFFEITDMYYDPNLIDPHAVKKDLASKFKNRARNSKAAKWHVMYTEELDPGEITYNPLHMDVVDVLDCQPTSTYLACNMSPGFKDGPHTATELKCAGQFAIETTLEK